MAKVTIKIDTGNDAFTPEEKPEIARILRELAQDIELGGDLSRKVYDRFGNFVGTMTRKR